MIIVLTHGLRHTEELHAKCQLHCCVWQQAAISHSSSQHGHFPRFSIRPLLYTIFSDDLSLFVQGTTAIQYKDDTQLMVCGSKTSLADLRVHGTGTVISWF